MHHNGSSQSGDGFANDDAYLLAPGTLTDQELCAAIREGEVWPLASLWQRYHGQALSWARGRDYQNAEDAVSSAFDSVFRALVDGGGPTESFSSYLFRSISTELQRAWGISGRIESKEDLDREDLIAPSGAERVSESEERQAAATALMELPARWKHVILEVDVGGRPVGEVASELDLTANSTSVLLKRARAGLRKSWLKQMHPPRGLKSECANCVSDFSEVRWGKATSKRKLRAEAHIATCRDCKSRWRKFVEQATVIGMVSAGVLAVEGRGRRIAPAAALAAVGLVLVSGGIALPLVLNSENDAATVPTHVDANADDSNDASYAGSGGVSDKPHETQPEQGTAEIPAGSDGPATNDVSEETPEGTGGFGGAGVGLVEIPNSANVNVNDLDLDADGIPGANTNKVWTRWGDLRARKVAAEDLTRGLEGAEFRIWMSELTAGCLGTRDLELVRAAGGEPFTVVSGASGGISIEGLWIGDDELVDGVRVNGNMQRCYVLEEIAAPRGYSLPEGEKKLTEFIVGQDAKTHSELMIVNNRQSSLILVVTGTQFGVPMLVVGSILVFLSGVLFLIRRRKS